MYVWLIFYECLCFDQQFPSLISVRRIQFIARTATRSVSVCLSNRHPTSAWRETSWEGLSVSQYNSPCAAPYFLPARAKGKLKNKTKHDNNNIKTYETSKYKLKQNKQVFFAIENMSECLWWWWWQGGRVVGDDADGSGGENFGQGRVGRLGVLMRSYLQRQNEHFGRD